MPQATTELRRWLKDRLRLHQQIVAMLVADGQYSTARPFREQADTYAIALEDLDQQQQLLEEQRRLEAQKATKLRPRVMRAGR